MYQKLINSTITLNIYKYISSIATTGRGCQVKLQQKMKDPTLILNEWNEFSIKIVYILKISGDILM